MTRINTGHQGPTRVMVLGHKNQGGMRETQHLELCVSPAQTPTVQRHLFYIDSRCPHHMTLHPSIPFEDSWCSHMPRTTNVIFHGLLALRLHHCLFSHDRCEFLLPQTSSSGWRLVSPKHSWCSVIFLLGHIMPPCTFVKGTGTSARRKTGPELRLRQLISQI